MFFNLLLSFLLDRLACTDYKGVLAIDVAWSVCLSAYLSVCVSVRPSVCLSFGHNGQSTKTAEPIGLWTRVCPRNHLLG